tara:strand:- start:1391 stop:1939 length:549 start_codon:yes stop_codon:yes gene_type:complete
MATILDIGILEYFAPMFVFFFVLVVVWALLEKTGFFGDNKMINWAIALCIALLFVVVPELSEILSTITPFFVILFIFLILVILVFLFMGYQGDFILDIITKNQIIAWTIILISLGILGYAVSMVYGDQIHDLTSGETTDEENLGNVVGQIIFHPKVLGVGIILLMAALIVRFVSGSALPGSG